MSPAEKLIEQHISPNTDLSRIPSAARIAAARDKYATAVKLYASSTLSIREIAEQLGLTPRALSHHLSRHHRHLLYKRYGLDVSEDDPPVKIKSPRGQSRKTHQKYKEAIEAAGDIAYIEFNISQIARLFDLNPTGLSTQLKVHYPDIIPAREAFRKRMGIADSIHSITNVRQEPCRATVNATDRSLRLPNFTLPPLDYMWKVARQWLRWCVRPVYPGTGYKVLE